MRYGWFPLETTERRPELPVWHYYAGRGVIAVVGEGGPTGAWWFVPGFSTTNHPAESVEVAMREAVSALAEHRAGKGGS